MLHYFQALHHILAADGDILLMRMAAVRTGCDNNSNVLILDADAVKLCHDDRQELARAAQTRNITDNDSHGFASMYKLAQRLRANRITNCFQSSSL